MICVYQEQAISIRSLQLSMGGLVNDVKLKCCVWGDVNKPLVVLLGGISATRWALSSHNGEGWWQQVVNDEQVLNTKDYSFLSFDYFSLEDGILVDGNENTAQISTADQARILRDIQLQLDLPCFFAVVGSSYGGMVALAFAAQYPSALEQVVCIAAADKNSVKTQAIRYIQRQIIRLGLKSADPAGTGEHLALARSLAVIGYRGEAEFEHRFQSDLPGGSLINVSGYLSHQGNKFKQVFSASRYLQLSKSIDIHQVEVSRITVPTHLIAIDSDQLVPLVFIQSLQKQLQSHTTFNTISSQYGHDGFLLEAEQINHIFKTIFNSNLNEQTHDTIKPNHRCASGY